MMNENVRKFEEVSDPEIRQRMAFNDVETKQYLDDMLESIIAHRAVQHPFLTWYGKHQLTDAQQRLLYLECFYFFRYLPFYITGMSLHTRDELILREIVLNVYDEVGGDITHSTLYRDFLHQIGITDEEIAGHDCLPVTTALNEGIRRLYTEGPIEKSLGALYADETMSSIMTGLLNDGLENQGYDRQVRNFWILHTQVEIGHSNSVFNAIFPYMKDMDNRALFEQGMSEFLGLVEAYWDGVRKLLKAEA